MTAGNSTTLTDGASVALLSSEEWAEQHNIPVRAYLVDSEVAGVDFVHGDDGVGNAGFDKASKVYTDLGTPPASGYTAEDLYTNEFIDTSISF